MLAVRTAVRGGVRAGLRRVRAAATAGGDGAPPPYVPCVGLEVHCRIASDAKLLSRAPSAGVCGVNEQVAWFDYATPGALPRVNMHCVEQATRAAVALRGRINRTSFFDRKHYNYFDLPHGFQVTQQRVPLMEGGVLDMLPSGAARSCAGDYASVRIARLHVEIDTAKADHDSVASRTLVDFNRAGTPLMEIVTEPELTSGAQAANFIRNLQTLLRFLGVSSANLEDGSMRVDANVSVSRDPARRGERVEIKNMNTVRGLQHAIECEVERQVAQLERGERVARHSRTYSVATRSTRVLRLKESALDYRFFPEPDLLPLVVSQALLDRVTSQMPRLPRSVYDALVAPPLGVAPDDALRLVQEPGAFQFFERCVEAASSESAPADAEPRSGGAGAGAVAAVVAKWMVSEVFGLLHSRRLSFGDCPLSPGDLAFVVTHVSRGSLQGLAAKGVLERVIARGEPRSVRDIVSTEGLLVESSGAADDERLVAMCRELVAAHPDEVSKFRAGRTSVLGYFVGRAMKQTGNRANARRLNELFAQLLQVPTSSSGGGAAKCDASG